jgi:hypothetical protein
MLKDPLLKWLASDDTGLSSRFILAYMERDTTVSAMDGFRINYPHDPDDLGRCIRLMDIEPSYRERIMELAHLCPEWAALASHWGELEALYHEEVPGHRGSAPRCYYRMYELIHRKPYPGQVATETKETP